MRNAGGSNGTKVVRAVRDWVSSALKSAGLPDRLEVGGEKKGGVGNDTQVSGLGDQKDMSPMTDEGNDWKESFMGKEDGTFLVSCLK